SGRKYGSVRVRWEEDPAPAPCVTVVLFDWNRPNPYLTKRFGVTGADGTVRIERVPAGEVDVVTNDDKWTKVDVPAGGEAAVARCAPRWVEVAGIVGRARRAGRGRDGGLRGDSEPPECVRGCDPRSRRALLAPGGAETARRGAQAGVRRFVLRGLG